MSEHHADIIATAFDTWPKSDVFDAIDGLLAWDTGCVSSGVNDEALKERVRSFINDGSEKRRMAILNEYAAVMYLSEEGLRAGYGIEDVTAFWNWIDNGMTHQ